MAWSEDNGWGNGPVEIMANGRTFEYDKEDLFVETVRDVAKQIGYGKYRVLAGGVEIEKPADAPDTLGEAEGVITILRYDEAG